MNCRAICLIISLAALALPRPLYAQELEICGDPRQGELLLGKAGANATEVLLNGEKAYPVDENGEFILALPRDAGKMPSWWCIIKTMSDIFSIFRWQPQLGMCSE